MRFFNKFSLLTIVSTAAVSAVCAQKGSFDVRLALNSVDCKNGKALVSVQVKASDDSQIFNMGDANYRFEYNAAQLRNPILVKQENFSSQATQADRNYGQQNIQGSRELADKGIVSLNTFYTGSEAGTKNVPNSWLPVSTLSFDIADYRNPTELTWHDNRNFPVSGMNQVKVTNSDPTAFEYELTDVPYAGKFLNLMVNPSSACPSKAAEVAVTAVKTKRNQTIEVFFPIYDIDENDVHTVKLMNVGNGTATPSVVGKQLKLSYTPEKDFLGKDIATMMVTDKFGNQTSVTVNITVTTDALIVHNAISPNDDGFNDNFVVDGLENFPKHSVAVYDQNGTELMKTQNYKNDWKATYKSKQVLDGTYYYVVEAGDDTYTGYIQVQR